MVIDTSALMAILLREPEHLAFVEAIDAAAFRRMSIVSFVEVSTVALGRAGTHGLHELDSFTRRANIEFIPVDAEQGQIARMAFSRFGKGRHPACLNLGDCFSYALAKFLGEPLLCKGNDFVRTDLTMAL